jgi:branched-chain amino acid transport system ATP-binding protein
MRGAPLLEVDGLSAGYGASEIVHEMSLSVGAGECVGLIGPNGHGKTTFLLAVTGLMRAWSGTVRFDGRDVTGWPAFRIARLGMVHVPQGDFLFADMTVTENLLAAAQADRWGRREALIHEVMEAFPALEDRRGQVAGTLSGGERRMLALARGLMMNARLMILDEPSLGLAPRIVAELYDSVRGLVERGVGVLVVEESPERLRDFAASIYLMEAGRLVKHGQPAEVLADPQLLSTYLGTGVQVQQPAGAS